MHELRVEPKPGYLHFTVTGVQSPETDAAIDVEVREHCRRHGVRAALVDIRPLNGRLSLVDNHVAAASMYERLGDTVVALAIIDAPQHGAEADMFELTATNRGMNVRFFIDVDTAAAWLRSRVPRRVATD